MENLLKLQAILTVHADNFRILHWKACGKNFDSAHKIAGDYYDMVSDDVDNIAEILLRYDVNPLNIFNCIKVAVKSGTNVSIPPQNDYTKEEVIKYSGLILTEILNVIAEALEEAQNPVSVGVKAYLESLYDKYDKESRYLNKRRSK